jgi:hydroxymethylglutaryl-CoA lyase
VCTPLLAVCRHSPSVMESFDRYQPVCQAAKAAKIRIRGGVSCVLGCPYRGHVTQDFVAFVTRRLYEMGCEEITLADTVGVGTPVACAQMLEAVKVSVACLHAT